VGVWIQYFNFDLRGEATGRSRGGWPTLGAWIQYFDFGSRGEVMGRIIAGR
jgi:hypothetical protein